MAAAAMDLSEQGTETLAAADFQALEERVLRAVELLKAEREAHAVANSKIEDLQRQNSELERQLAGRAQETSQLETEISQLQQERDHVRSRVERLLKHLDEFTA
jgi:septal ring factor EnvC (AmiA/AmiB activator)